MQPHVTIRRQPQKFQDHAFRLTVLHRVIPNRPSSINVLATLLHGEEFGQKCYDFVSGSHSQTGFCMEWREDSGHTE